MLTAMPRLPIIISGRRPKRSTVKIANTVNERLITPTIIVCVGRISAQRYISKDFRVTKEHGLFYDRNGILYMGTFHPAALLRNPNQKPAAFEDFIALRGKINEICDHTY